MSITKLAAMVFLNICISTAFFKVGSSSQSHNHFPSQAVKTKKRKGADELALEKLVFGADAKSEAVVDVPNKKKEKRKREDVEEDKPAWTDTNDETLTVNITKGTFVDNISACNLVC